MRELMVTADVHKLDEVRRVFGAWLDENWDPECSLREWRETFVDAHWAKPSWPERWWGRGLDPESDAIVASELARREVPGIPIGASTRLAAPTLLAHASDTLKSRLLRPILIGDHTWCQLFSEPGSGSDLAGLSTRAERDGEEFVINGQKVWSTSAHHATFGMLLARTDWDVPKHRGITYFALPMDQPGVEVRPLRQMNGKASFNEVFLTDARVPASNVVGQMNAGWQVALTTLAHERGLARHHLAVESNPNGRVRREAAVELREYLETYDWYPQRGGRPDLVVEHAAATGRSRDPVVRQELARLISWVKIAEWTAERTRSAVREGRSPGPTGSIGKLNSTRIARLAAHVHTLAGGVMGTVAGVDVPFGGVIAEVHSSVPAVSIAGGTDEIQRSIVAERLLGLPKDVSVDRDVPFRNVQRS